MSWFEDFKRGLQVLGNSDPVGSFQAGLGVLGSGDTWSNAGQNFQRGLGVLGDTYQDKGALPMLGQLAGGATQAFRRGAGMEGKSTYESLRGGLGDVPAAFIGSYADQLSDPAMVLAPAVGGLASGAVQGGVRGAAAFGRGTSALADAMANSRVAQNLGAGNLISGEASGFRIPRSAAQVAADMKPINDQILRLHDVTVDPHWGATAMGASGPVTEEALQKGLDLATDMHAQAARQGVKTHGFYMPASAEEMAAGRPGGTVVQYDMGNPLQSQATMAHEMFHGGADTAQAMNLVENLPPSQRLVAYAQQSSSPYLRGLSELGNEIGAHGAEAAALGPQTLPRQAMNFVKGGTEFLTDPWKATQYGVGPESQFAKLDPSGTASFLHGIGVRLGELPRGAAAGVDLTPGVLPMLPPALAQPVAMGFLGGTAGGVGGTALYRRLAEASQQPEQP